ncbi:hypothetical protein Tco_0561916 [Tanacetum coccineum]
MLIPNQDTGVDAIFGQHAEATSQIDIPVTAIVEPSFFAPSNCPLTLNPLFIQLQQPPILTPATTPSFPTTQISSRLLLVYLANKLKEAVDVAVQLKYDRIREETHTENQQFLDSIDEGMKKVIKELVKKEVSKITPKIEKLVNEQLESKVLLKKILILKVEVTTLSTGQHQRQLYKALVDAYEADKILLDTYGDTITIKRPRDDADDDQEPSAGTDRGKTTTDVFEAPAHQEFETGVHDEQAEEEVHHLPDWFQTFELMKEHARVLTETLNTFDEEVLQSHNRGNWTGSTQRPPISFIICDNPLRWFQISRSSCYYVSSLSSITGLEYLRGGESSRKYSTSVTKTKAADYGHIKWIEDLVPNSIQFYAFATTRESAHDVYSKRRIIAVTKVEIVKWQNYSLLTGLLGKVTNLNVEERIAFNVSLRMFTRSVVIQRRVEDLQLGVESYQKKLNLTKLTSTDPIVEKTRDDLIHHTRSQRIHSMDQRTEEKKN